MSTLAQVRFSPRRQSQQQISHFCFLGYRVPFTIISPWTRGGNVFTEHADHNSQIMFVETWLEALGYKGVITDQMPSWRRAHMSNLVNAFDFDNVSLHPH